MSKEAFLQDKLFQMKAVESYINSDELINDMYQMIKENYELWITFALSSKLIKLFSSFQSNSVYYSPIVG